MKSPRELHQENINRIDLILNKGYNPNRDKLGRFSTGTPASKGEKIIEKQNSSYGISIPKDKISKDYATLIAELDKKKLIMKSDILLGDITPVRDSKSIIIKELFIPIKYDSNKMILYRAGNVDKKKTGKGVFFSVKGGVADLYGETFDRSVKKYKLKNDLKIIMAHNRAEVCGRLGFDIRDIKSQEKLETLAANQLRKFGYHGIIYDGLDVDYGTTMSDQNGEVQLFNAIDVVSEIK